MKYNFGLDRFISSERTKKLSIHVILTAIFKVGSIAINLILVPIYIEILDPSIYGVWLALSSVLTWFQFFDLGLGNGLRNRLVECSDDLLSQRKLISSAYAMIGIPSFLLILLFSFLPFYLDLPNLLKIESEVGQEMLGYALAWLGVSFGAQLLLKTVTYILLAKQEASVNSMLNFMINGLLLLVFGSASLGWFNFDFYDLAIVNSIIPVIVLIILTAFWFEIGALRQIKPSLKLVELSQMKSLSSLGFRFLVIQISAVVLFSTDNIIISYLFDDYAVSEYAIHHKLFQVPVLAFSILLQPYWSAFSEAQKSNDWLWIKRSLIRIRSIYFFFIPLILLLVLIAPNIMNIWVGQSFSSPVLLRLSMGIYVLLSLYGSIYVTAVNGLGKVDIQMYFSLVNMVVNVPLSIYFASNLDLGTAGVILASAICLSYGPFIAPFHVGRIIRINSK